MFTRLTRLKIVAGVLLSSALCLAAPTAASAHNPEASATCTTLTVDLQSYQSSADAPASNSVTVIVDGDEVVTDRFGASYTATFALGDSTLAHTWVVEIDAVDEGYDTSRSGSSEPCVAAEPVAASAAIALADASCTSGELLVLGDIANAAWGEVSGDGASYSVTATAFEGYLFDDDQPTRVFIGELAPPLPASSCPLVTIDSTEVVVEPPLLVSDIFVSDDAQLAHSGIDPTLGLLIAFGLLGCGLALRHGDHSALSGRKTH